MKKKIPFALVTIILLSAVYSSIAGLSFATVDDKWMLLDEKLITARQFNWNFIIEIFSRINSLQYSPLNTLYYYLIYQLNGYDPYYYHLGSLFLHTLNAALVFILFKRVFEVFEISNTEILSFGTMLIWAIHPLNVESVIWISASKIPLYTFFGLISFLLFINAYLKRKTILYIGALACFVLSFLAKEQAVLFPVMMLAFVIVHQKKYRQTIEWKRVFRYFFPLFLLAFVFGMITVYVAVYGQGSHEIDRFPFKQRIILVFYALCFYIFNNFVPFNLHYHYPFPMKLGEALPMQYYLYPLMFSLILWQLLLIIKQSKNYYFYIFCFCMFITHLLLSIQVFPLARASMLADRYMYISSLALISILVVIVNEKWDLSFRKADKSSIVILFLFITYVSFLGYYSINLAESWKGMQL